LRAEAWNQLSSCLPKMQTSPWLENMLLRNQDCAYMKHWGQPTSQKTYRNQVPLTDYEQLYPWIERVIAGESSVLFHGRPVAFEKTGGSSSGQKLIPYTTEGLIDFRRTLLPWLTNVVARHHISGSAYFSLSPACRETKYLAGIPVGLSDIDYVGTEAGAIFAKVCAVPHSVGSIVNHTEWREKTLHYLRQAQDLELISAWSPTFLLKLFEGEATEKLLPNLRVISCWTDGVSTEYAEMLQNLFPHVTIEPKGLMSTEAAITVPDEYGQPSLTDTGFFEFLSGDNIWLENELVLEHEYEVVATTASGLYRYRTGDIVRYIGRNHKDRAILRFIGRQGLVCDLVGEKLTDSFVSACFKDITGSWMLVPNAMGDGYTFIADQMIHLPEISLLEKRLMKNPQYAYARKLAQLQPLATLQVRNLWDYYEQHQVAQGVRLGDIKPVALRNERYWVNLFKK
jgi:hypothetical protein